MTRPVALILPLLALCSGALAQKITSFETPAEVAILRPSGLQAEQSREHATDGQHSLKVTVKGSATDSWPGLDYAPANPDLSQAAVLAMDVFNPQDFPISLSFRLDDASGKNKFTGAEIKPGPNRIELWLTASRFDLDMKHVARIYPYFRMPRRDFVLFFDNVRIEAATARFKAMAFEETNPEPAYSGQDRARGYVVFARPWLSTVFPDSRPLPHELAPTLSVFGCPGQTVPVTFCLRALQDLGQTTVAPADLTGGGQKLPAEALRVYPVSYRNKRLVYSSQFYVKDMPTILERREFVPVPKDRTQLFWINVAIPADQPAGLYTGQLTVKPTQGQPVAVPLQVRVLPYRLVEPRNMFFGEYYQPPQLAKTPEEKLATVARDLQDQREHGMTSLGLCYGPNDDEFTVEGTNVTLNLKPDGLYSKTMETYKALGFPMPIIQLNDTGQTPAAKFPFGSPEYIATYKSFWIALAKMHQERGWPEMIVQPVDEPAWQGPDERSRNLACLKWLKEIPGQRTEEDGPVDGYFLSEAGPFADVWNGNGAVPAPDVMKKAQVAGRIITSYNNDVESYRPEMGRYCNGFYQLRAGARGTFNWAYISFAGDPYDDLSADTGSWMHVYPPLPELGEVGGASTGWEGARAGVDDFRFATRCCRPSDGPRGLAARPPAARPRRAGRRSVMSSPACSTTRRPAARRISGKSCPDRTGQRSSAATSRFRMAGTSTPTTRRAGSSPARRWTSWRRWARFAWRARSACRIRAHGVCRPRAASSRTPTGAAAPRRAPAGSSAPRSKSPSLSWIPPPSAMATSPTRSGSRRRSWTRSSAWMATAPPASRRRYGYAPTAQTCTSAPSWPRRTSRTSRPASPGTAARSGKTTAWSCTWTPPSSASPTSRSSSTPWARSTRATRRTSPGSPPCSAARSWTARSVAGPWSWACPWAAWG